MGQRAFIVVHENNRGNGYSHDDGFRREEMFKSMMNNYKYGSNHRDGGSYPESKEFDEGYREGYRHGFEDSARHAAMQNGVMTRDNRYGW